MSLPRGFMLPATLPTAPLEDGLAHRICATANAGTEPAFRRTARYRFDDPARGFSTLYCAPAFATCFLETLVRDATALRVSRCTYDANSIALLLLDAEQLRLVDLFSTRGMAALRVDLATLASDRYAKTQRLARTDPRSPGAAARNTLSVPLRSRPGGDRALCTRAGSRTALPRRPPDGAGTGPRAGSRAAQPGPLHTGLTAPATLVRGVRLVHHAAHAAQRRPHPHHARRQPAAAARRWSSCWCARSRGEPVDAAALDAAVEAATRARRRAAARRRHRRRQRRRAAARELLHLRAAPHERLRRRAASGRSCATSPHFPSFLAAEAAASSRATMVSLMSAPQAIGAGALRRPRRRSSASCDALRARRWPTQPRGFAEIVLTAPSPGIVACGDAERALPDARASTSTPSPTRCATEYEAIVARGLRAADRRARPGDGAPHRCSPTGRSTSSSTSSTATSRRSTARSRDVPPTACACTSAGATTRRRTSSTCRSRTILPLPLRAPASARWCCRWPTRATRTSTACFARHPLPDGHGC